MIWLLWLACVQPVEPSAVGVQEADALGGPVDPDWGKAKWTQNKKYEVSLHTKPAPVQMGELFTMVATVKDREGKVIEDATVSLDAQMPHHGHGMATNPVNSPGDCSAKDTVDLKAPDDKEAQAQGEQVQAPKGRCVHPGGRYETTGFKFHMTGEWTVLVDIVGPLGRENTSFIYNLR